MKINKKLVISCIVVFGLMMNVCNVKATAPQATGSGDFVIEVPDNITVTVTRTEDSVSGKVGVFMRNIILLHVVSNNQYGFTSTLKTKTATTALTNTLDNTLTIPTLAAATTQANFSVNHWGYSEDDEATVSSTSNYAPLTAAGTTLSSASASSATSVSENIYFGMKADGTVTSGTYANTIVIAVVGKTDGGGTQTDPTPSDDPEIIADNTDDNVHTVVTETDYTNGTTQRTTERDSDDKSETSTSSYATPQGVKNENTIFNNINIGMIVAGAVAVASVTGLIFIIVAGKRDDEEEDEEE